MKTTKTKTIKQKVIVYKCDDCDKNSKGKKCCMCGKDLCDACTIFDDEDWSDYPDRYCNNCWNVIGKKYRDKIEQLENEIEMLQDKWQEEVNKGKQN